MFACAAYRLLLLTSVSSLALGVAACAIAPQALVTTEIAAKAQSQQERLVANQEPVGGPVSLYEAMARALANEDQAFAATRWSDALSAAGQQRGWGGTRLGSRLIDARQISVSASAADAGACSSLKGACSTLRFRLGSRRARRFD